MAAANVTSSLPRPRSPRAGRGLSGALGSSPLTFVPPRRTSVSPAIGAPRFSPARLTFVPLRGTSVRRAGRRGRARRPDSLAGVTERLTHLDEHGSARMVDVGAKPVTERRAVARAVVRMAPETARAVQAGDAPKGDVLGTARIAGIMAAKRTGELIPLCHPIALDHVDVEGEVDPDTGAVTLTATAGVTAKTGIEMEAMTAAAVAALTVYDMVKGLERGVTIESVQLLEKSGGRSGTWRR